MILHGHVIQKEVMSRLQGDVAQRSCREPVEVLQSHILRRFPRFGAEIMLLPPSILLVSRDQKKA